MNLSRLPRIRLAGPFWRAEADVLRASQPSTAWDLRTLFADLDASTQDEVLRPGTLLVLCWVRSVTIQPTSSLAYDFQRSNNESPPSGPLSTADIARRVLEGQLALLLVAADRRDWDDSVPNDRLGTLTVLAGHVALDVLRPETSATRRNLFRDLDLVEAPLVERAGACALPGALSVHASGLTAYGGARLPWESARVTAPFQVTPVVPDTAPGSRVFRMTVERERLVDAERAAIVAAWSRLAKALNPGNPAFGGAPVSAPSWATLEVANPASIPRMYWELAPWQAAPPRALPVHVEREEVDLLLSDQSPYDRARPATTFARTVLDSVTIERKAPSGGRPGPVVVTIAASREGRSGSVAGRLDYTAAAESGGWREQFTATGLHTAYHPTETPRLLRELSNVSAPEWAPATVEKPAKPLATPFLWAFMPLEDGWAQLPVPNLTDQIYLDVGLARDTSGDVPPGAEGAARSALLSGAVSFGNDKPGTLAKLPMEHAWTMTLLDADEVSGTITLEQATATAPLVHSRTALALVGPEVTFNGLVWLATGSPSLENALPSLDDWVDGLRPITLRTVDSEVDILPPLLVATVPSLSFGLRKLDGSFPWAELGAWSIQFDVRAATLNTLVTKQVLDPEVFRSPLPLVWRRHRTLPMIQALPLTQKSSPPNFPSPSRQLVPFELQAAQIAGSVLFGPFEWRFGRQAGNGAAAWALAQGTFEPAEDWKKLADLPLASLSLPGLVLDPRDAGVSGLPVDGTTQLPQQYRHDLPYADEAHALAQLPKITDPRASGAPDERPPEPLQPLVRETLAAHWAELSERASLAAADAVAATAPAAASRVAVQSIVEPFAWTTSASLQTASYPGELVFANASGAASGARTLARESALEGISGHFVEEAGNLRLAVAPAAPAYEVVAGSMAAFAATGGSFRDQRGLFRGATRVSGRILRTPVRLAEAVELTSLLEAVPMFIGPGASEAPASMWRLWFRDLPAVDGAFELGKTRSSAAEDVNDPEAGSRGYNHLNGWEWRLEPEGTAEYRIFGLLFFPTTLDRVRLDADGVRHVELVGRLQLPVAGVGELEELASAVRLTFAWNATTGRLELSAARIESSMGEWPLAPATAASGSGASITWKQVSLDPLKNAVLVADATLVFHLFGAEWRVPLAPLRFTAAAAPMEQRWHALGAFEKEPISPREVLLRVDPEGHHELSLLFGVALGRGVQNMFDGARDTPIRWQALPPAATTRTIRTVFSANVRFHVLGPEAGQTLWEKGFVFDDLELSTEPDPSAPEDVTFAFTSNAFEFRFGSYVLKSGSRLQLLAGMHLADGAAPGFVALTFDVLASANDVPTLRLTSSFVEAVVRCRWGEFLQETARAGSNSLARVCGSSAGDLLFGYTGESHRKIWTESTVLNGFLELKDLVSWPTRMTFDAAKRELGVPAARSAASLDHLRHTIRILFDQHAIPEGILEPATGDLVFELVPDRAWQFLAVVEHQLVEVLPGAGFDVLATGSDRRWTTVQEVRFLSPASFEKDLLAIKNQRLRILNTDGNAQLIGDASLGYLGTGLRTRLAEGVQSSLDALQRGTLVVEASAVHWLKEIPVTASAATPLQYLPGGTQLASLSRPEDYGPTDPRHPGWLLLQMPFFGRLQDERRDLAEPPSPSAPLPLLQIDPVLNLQRRRAGTGTVPPLILALCGWAEKTPVVATFAAVDSAVGRTFARLDPRALEESWFFLQTPAPERAPTDALASVLESLPSSLARLGRPSTLAALFNPRRTSYPPEPSPSVLSDDTVDELVWRVRHLFVIQAVSNVGPNNATPYGWLTTASQIVSGWLTRDTAGASGPRLHAAATAMPVKVADNPVPSGIAVSPFLGFERHPAPDAAELRVVVAELLCVNPASGRLQPVATQNWEDSDRRVVRQQAATWARETHRRLSPESPIAVLRFRELSQNVTGDPDRAVLVTSYDFALVGLPAPTLLANRTFRLRAGAAELRYRDGHFGGADVPAALHEVEIAPPQVAGVQPLYLLDPPNGSSAEARWPWGFSALSTVVNYADGKRGAAGRSREPTALLWQSLQHQVQYRSALSGQPAAGLPRAFRARVIRSLLPVLPDPPVPSVSAPALHVDGAPSRRFQPVLPGSLRTTVLGARPGVFLSMRHQLLRQAVPRDPERPGDERLVAGGVPVQHRAPRPVPLPANRGVARDVALRPWASWFEPELGLVARTAPVDEAHLAASGDQPARRFQLRILEPARGEIRADWRGAIRARIVLESPDARIDEWLVSLSIEHRGHTVRYAQPAPTPAPAPVGDGVFDFDLERESADEKALIELLQQMRPGEALVLKAAVTRAQGGSGFHQHLSFPLRLLEEKAVRLPLEPFFVLFEDPEYNRLLSSEAKHATRLAKTMERAELMVHAVTLATDRAEYGPDDRVALRFDFDDDSSRTGSLTMRVLDETGIARPLSSLVGGTLRESRALKSGTLLELELATLYEAGGARATLAPGHTLELKLTLTPTESEVVERVEVVLGLNVARESVTPVPQAAYALLRKQVTNGEPQVECVRFAWSPAPTRVELTNPNDLRTTIVRRRAVFRWTDTARNLTAQGYAVQKITRTGSTHFPDPDVIERASDE